MKGTKIFNLKALALEAEDPAIKNIYHRIFNADKGNKSGLTLELVNKLIKVVTSNSNAFLNELKAEKARIIESNKSKKAA